MVKVFSENLETFQQLTESKKDLMGQEFIGNNEANTFSFKKGLEGSINEEVYMQYLNDKAILEKLSAKGKAKKIFPVLTKMIKLNPFDKTLIQERLRLAKGAKNESFVESDTALLEALDELLEK